MKAILTKQEFLEMLDEELTASESAVKKSDLPFAGIGLLNALTAPEAGLFFVDLSGLGPMLKKLRLLADALIKKKVGGKTMENQLLLSESRDLLNQALLANKKEGEAPSA